MEQIAAAIPADLPARLLPLILAYLRIQMAVLIFPVLSERLVSVRIKAVISVLLAPVGLALSGVMAVPGDMTPPLLFGMALRELLAGALIALPARLIFMSMHMASSAIAATASLSQLIGTGTEAAPHPVGTLLHMAGLALLMAMGLPLLLVDVIAESYEVLPMAGATYLPQGWHGIVALVARSFMLAMALASPFILGGLLYQLLSGVVNRVMPSLPVVFIGAPAIILLALFALTVLSPAILSGWASAVFDGAYWP